MDHDEYDVKILFKHHRIFGPFPVSYREIADEQRLAVLSWIMQNSSAETLKPFHLTTADEICEEDKQFVLKVMKMDPRDRPTARALLEDEWFGSAPLNLPLHDGHLQQSSPLPSPGLDLAFRK